MISFDSHSRHIIAAALTMLEMKTVNDIPSERVLPNAQNLWMESATTRKEVLEKTCKELLDTFVSFSFHTEDSKMTTDKVREYGRQLLGLGLLYEEYSDAIREGDGERLLRCWRYLLPIFKASGRKNYACEVLNMLYQHQYQLPQLSSQLLWSRFVNLHGRPGKNIPGDLHMEHLNRLAKEAIKNLGANKTEKGSIRVGKAIGTIGPVLQQFDNVSTVSLSSGAHRRASIDKDRNIVINELMKKKVFQTILQRKHCTFPHSKNILRSIPKKDLLDWMVQTHHELERH